MSDPLTTQDLDLLAQLLARLLNVGLSEEAYRSLIADLQDVQTRVRSVSTLSWSLDVCEALAMAPCPPAVRENRLRYFTQVLGDAQTYFHRLQRHDLVAIELLARDFGVDPASLEILRAPPSEVADEAARVDLTGKKIGIYTLVESAGLRAKLALQKMYPGCIVEINSDVVNTERLTSLAKSSDLFIFAWRSSSHQAFYCVKAALGGEPIYAPGKGSASILAAVADNLTR